MYTHMHISTSLFALLSSLLCTSLCILLFTLFVTIIFTLRVAIFVTLRFTLLSTLYFASPCSALPCFVLSCLASLCLALLCLALPCFALPCLALPCFALLCLALPCVTLLCFALPCFALRCLPSPCFAGAPGNLREAFSRIRGPENVSEEPGFLKDAQEETVTVRRHRQGTGSSRNIRTSFHRPCCTKFAGPLSPGRVRTLVVFFRNPGFLGGAPGPKICFTFTWLGSLSLLPVPWCLLGRPTRLQERPKMARWTKLPSNSLQDGAKTP